MCWARPVTAGPFYAEQMVTLEQLEALADGESFDAMDDLLLPAETALEALPLLELPESVAFYLKQGQPVLVPHSPTEGLVRLCRSGGAFIGVGEVLEDGRIAPRRLFAKPIRNPFSSSYSPKFGQSHVSAQRCGGCPKDHAIPHTFPP